MTPRYLRSSADERGKGGGGGRRTARFDMPVFKFTVVRHGDLRDYRVVLGVSPVSASSRGFVGMRRRHIRAGYTLGALHMSQERGEREAFCSIFIIEFSICCMPSAAKMGWI